MSKDKDKVLLGTGDKKMIEQIKNRDGLIQIKSAEEFMALAEAAHKTKNAFDEIVQDLKEDQAREIRRWRVDIGSSWRRIAERAYEEGYLGADWSPPSNQLMGMALCEKAAQFFDEDYMSEPWN